MAKGTAIAKAVPAISKAAGKMATSAQGIKQGVVFGAGMKAAGEAFNAIKDPGFILFITGLLTFIFYKYVDNILLTTIIVTIFLFYTSLFIFKARGIVVTALFWFWFVFLKTTTDPKFILYYLGPILLIGMLAHGIFTWLKRRNFVEGSSGELIGLVPILFFFLDLGLIPLLTQTFNISLNIWIQYVPWWALLGLFTTKKENAIFSILRVVGVIYIFLIIFLGITPEAYGAYSSGSLGPEEFLKARETAQEQTAGVISPLNFFWINIRCMLGESTNIDSCIKREKEKIEIDLICEGKGFEEKTVSYDDCVKEERERKEKLQITGTVDTNIKEPTKIEFKTSEYFSKISYQPRYPYPAQLEIKNPREQKLVIDVTCYFKKDGQNVTGLVQPTKITIEKNKKEDQKSIVCTPTQDLKGKYKLIYQANIHDIKTTSTLKRLFIGDTSQKTKDEINTLKSSYVTGKNYLSQAPEEFARLNFGFGEPETNPIIESDDDPLFVSTIENVGGGRILSINSYYVDLGDKGIYPSHVLTGEKIPLQTQGCFSGPGTDIQVPLRKSFVKETIPIKSCFVTLPEELKNPEDFIVKTFKGYIIYDYQIEKEIDIEVKILTS